MALNTLILMLCFNLMCRIKRRRKWKASSPTEIQFWPGSWEKIWVWTQYFSVWQANASHWSIRTKWNQSVFLHRVRGEFSHCDGSSPEPSWHQLRWDPQHTQVERRHLLLHLFPPTPLLNVALKGTDASQTKVLHNTRFPQWLASVSQFHTLHELQYKATESCGFVISGGFVNVCVCVCLFVSSLTWVSTPNDPSLLPTGTQTVPNRFAVTLWSMRIPTTD